MANTQLTVAAEQSRFGTDGGLSFSRDLVCATMPGTLWRLARMELPLLMAVRIELSPLIAVLLLAMLALLDRAEVRLGAC
eukprot:2932785-Amphidinium_carterae.1